MSTIYFYAATVSRSDEEMLCKMLMVIIFIDDDVILNVDDVFCKVEQDVDAEMI